MHATIRDARQDDAGAIRSWLAQPSFLAASRLAPLDERQNATTDHAIRKAIANQCCAVIIIDNIRVAAAIWTDSDDSSDSVDVNLVSRLRLDWVLRHHEITNLLQGHILARCPRARINVAEEQLSTSQLSGPLHEKSSIDLSKSGRILLLGPVERNQQIIEALKRRGFEVLQSLNHDVTDDIETISWVISSGYHLRLPPLFCERFRDRIINIHAAKLPWGRGIGTTLFSVLLGYGAGVSIHLIDSGLDTGDLIVDSETVATHADTLRTMYGKLLVDCETLFIDFLNLLFSDGLTRQRQADIDPRSFARNRLEFETVMEVMPLGYDTPLSDIAELSQAMRRLKAARRFLST